jgi:hypothetical protein
MKTKLFLLVSLTIFSVLFVGCLDFGSGSGRKTSAYGRSNSDVEPMDCFAEGKILSFQNGYYSCVNTQNYSCEDSDEVPMLFNGQFICVIEQPQACNEGESPVLVGNAVTCMPDVAEDLCSPACDPIDEICAMKNNTGTYRCLKLHGEQCTSSDECYNLPQKSAECKIAPEGSSTNTVCWATGDGAEGSYCNLPADCNYPLICSPLTGKCAQQASGPTGQCTSNGDISSCNDNSVTSGGTSISCAGGKCYCKNGACYERQPAGSACDAGLSSSLQQSSCKTNICATGSGGSRICGCASWSDCPAGGWCGTNGLCNGPCQYGSTSSLGSCAPGYFCDNGILCKKKCTQDGADACTASGTACYESVGLCYLKQDYGSACGRSGVTPSSQSLSFMSCSDLCLSAINQIGVNPKLCGCTDKNQCPNSTQICWTNNKCESKHTKGQECRTEDDCASGLACDDGHCRVKLGGTCTDSSDCDSGLVCDSQSKCKYDINHYCNGPSDDQNCKAGTICNTYYYQCKSLGIYESDYCNRHKECQPAVNGSNSYYRCCATYNGMGQRFCSTSYNDQFKVTTGSTAGQKCSAYFDPLYQGD